MRLGQYVDLGVIRRNVAAVRALTGVRVLVMVKADAYGHGMTAVAHALRDMADFFGVATLEEGVELRKCAIKTPVLVAVCPADGLRTAAENGLTAAVADGETLRALADMPPSSRPAFHVKFDTGMHRLGFPAEDAGEVCRFLAERGLTPDGVYSHFRAPDEAQAEKFLAVAKIVKAEFPSATVHMASSSSLGMRSSFHDMVRIGHAAYRGAMRVESRVIAVRKVRAGECVGYGCTEARHDCTVAVVFGGYFDGVYKELPSPVLVGGRVCPVLGSVCMDMFAADVGDIPVRVGDPVVLLGDELTAERVAAARGTTDYEVMTSWHGRTERFYIDQAGSTQESECRGGKDERRGEGMGVGSDHERSHLP